MAINFLNKVDFNKNELDKARIVNEINDAAAGANPVIGQLYFNTTADTLKQYVADTQNPPNPGAPTPGWVEVGSSSAVESIDTTNTTYINMTPTAKTVGNVVLTSSLSAVDGTSNLTTRFLSKDNTWDVITNPIATATTLGTVKLFSDTEQTVAATAVSATAARTYGVQFNSDDQMVVNVPWTDVNVVTYDLTTGPIGTTTVRLTGSNTTDDDVTISGTSGQTVTSRIGAQELRVALTPSVVIANDLTLTSGNFVVADAGDAAKGNLTVAKAGSFGGQVTIPTVPTLPASAASKAYVDERVAGIGVYQGPYNAATDRPVLTGVAGGGFTQLAYDVGDYFVVSVAGNAFFNTQLEPGDFIFVDTAIAAGSVPTSAKYTVIIADANIASAGATDALANKGVAGFDSANFTVTANGWVQLKEEVISGRMRKIALTGGTDSGGQTTFTVNLATLFGATPTPVAADAIATVKETTSSLIVYPIVTGNGTGSLDFKFIPTVSDSTYTAIISIV